MLRWFSVFSMWLLYVLSMYANVVSICFTMYFGSVPCTSMRFPWVFLSIHVVGYIFRCSFHLHVYVLLRFSMSFHVVFICSFMYFPMHFHEFACVFLWFPCVFLRASLWFPCFFACISWVV